MVEQMEVWSSVLLAHLSEDHIICRLWMCSTVMQKLITANLGSLVVNVRYYKKYRSSTTGNNTGRFDMVWYAQPSFLSQLQQLKSLEIVIPHKDTGLNKQSMKTLTWDTVLPHDIFRELPASLNFLEVYLPSMREAAKELFVVHCAVWLMENPNLVIGPNLSRSLALQSMVYQTLLSLTVQSLTNANGNCGNIAHQLAYLVGSGMTELVKVLEDPGRCCETHITTLAEVASRITTIHTVVENLNLVYHLRHFPNLKELKVHDSTDTTDHTLRSFMVVPIWWNWPSSLTDLFIVADEISWPVSWPAGLTSLRITTSIVDNEQYNNRIRSLPSSLRVLRYKEQQSLQYEPFNILDLESVAALPRSLTKLRLPILPVGCFNQDAELWYAQLPPNLTLLLGHNEKRVWKGMTGGIFSILPRQLRSLVITSGEPILDYTPYGNTLPKPTWDTLRDIPAILGSFTKLVELKLIITDFSHVIPNLPDTITSLTIQYFNVFHIKEVILMSETIRWPSSLRSLEINCVDRRFELSRCYLSLQDLGDLPNHVRSIIINIHHIDVKIIHPPQRWPQELQTLHILGIPNKHLGDLHKELAENSNAWPDQDVVDFRIR